MRIRFGKLLITRLSLNISYQKKNKIGWECRMSCAECQWKFYMNNFRHFPCSCKKFLCFLLETKRTQLLNVFEDQTLSPNSSVQYSLSFAVLSGKRSTSWCWGHKHFYPPFDIISFMIPISYRILVSNTKSHLGLNILTYKYIYFYSYAKQYAQPSLRYLHNVLLYSLFAQQYIVCQQTVLWS